MFSLKIMLVKQSKDQRNRMELKAVAFYPYMQTGVPHCVSYTTVNQRNQEIKHLKVFYIYLCSDILTLFWTLISTS